MASLIQGYEYDIFISYRQKDNKGDRWVSEFVEALRTELESTFKEEISVYFDINPHDGLLETHDVDASLKEKLKCLIFIPVISRTYCDPKSFAWEHEFRAFVEQASNDQYGIKIKLPNGNVASRVLPVKIYDLDPADTRLCETVLGGVLRGIEFIYAEPGVNRPLKSDDDEKINLNRTKYRNQVNKAANAIKEIILGLKIETNTHFKESVQKQERSKLPGAGKESYSQRERFRFSKVKMVAILSMIAISSAIIWVYPKVIQKNRSTDIIDPDGRIPVAIMPFQNYTGDESKNYFQEIIQDNIISYLSKYSGDINVIQIESADRLLERKNPSDYVSITPLVARRISRQMKANVYITGSIQHAGETMRLNAKITNSKTRETLKSYSIDGSFKDLIILTDSLSARIVNFLLISLLVKEENIEFQNFASTSTDSPEAFRDYIYGRKAFNKSNYPLAIDWLQKALGVDSDFYAAARLLSYAYSNSGHYKEGEKWCTMVYRNRDKLPTQMKIYIEFMNASYHGTSYERINYLEQLLKLNDRLPGYYEELGWEYLNIGQFEKAIPVFEKALEIFEKTGSKPPRAEEYFALGKAYHATGQYKKEKKLYIRAVQDIPDVSFLIYRQAVLALSEGDSVAGSRYIEKYIILHEGNSAPETGFITNLGGIYTETGILGKAEVYYRNEFSDNPDNPEVLNNLAYFLIDKDRDISFGITLIDKALKLCPDNYTYLHTKGWGLYKLGNYADALKFLQRADSIMLSDDHLLNLHLEEAKKAFSNQKNN